jgi:hypothetical protein
MASNSKRARQRRHAKWVWISTVPDYNFQGFPTGAHRPHQGTHTLQSDSKLIDRPLTGKERRQAKRAKLAKNGIIPALRPVMGH